MYKQEAVLENEILKILWDFEIKADHLIPARRPDLVIINQKKKKKKKREPAESRHCNPRRPESENQRQRKKETST